MKSEPTKTEIFAAVIEALCALVGILLLTPFVIFFGILCLDVLKL